MFAICSPYNHLLISALASILLLTLTAHAMPISQGAACPPSTGSQSTSGGSQSISPEQNSDSDDGTTGNDSCSDGAPPEHMINDIKVHLQEKPHPMFFISEMAEMLHRRLYYVNNYPNHCGYYEPIENETIEQVKEKILSYLNNNRLPTEADVACPPRYNIAYYPNRYPRYLVQVECPSSSVVSDGECRSTSCGPGRECRPYQLDDMLYLTKDSSGWSTRRAIEVGVGCKCSEY